MITFFRCKHCVSNPSALGLLRFQVPAITDAEAPPVATVLKGLPSPTAMLKRLTPADETTPCSWQVLASVQLVHAAAAPLLFAQVDAALAGEEPPHLLRGSVERLFEVLPLCSCSCF